MNTKICSRCKQDLELSNFSLRGKYADGTDRYRSLCKTCAKIDKDKHYRDNKQYYIDKAYKDKEKRKVILLRKLLDYFALHPCIDCGEDNPLVLEFDHLYDKKYNIAEKLAGGLRWETLIKEINKCEVRCANCHKIKTAKQQNWKILQMLGSSNG